MNISKYNIFTRDFVYNLISKNYLQLSESLADYLKNNIIIDEKFPNDILNVLKENNIVVDYDELQYIDFRYNSLKFNKERATYIIHPTLSCNFSCDYCFETIKHGTFSKKETLLLKNFIRNQFDKLVEINIQWSGGEPLLVWKSIKDISNIFNTYKGVYNISIATNGYLLTEKIIFEMKELNFSSIQITVDGPRDQHNQKRYTKNDKNTYEKVLKAIEVSSRYIRTRIRFNIDKKNANSFTSFLTDLNKFSLNKQNIEIYVKPIVSKHGCANDENLLESLEFFNQELQYIKLANEYSYNYTIHPNFKSDIRCIYHHVNSYAIDPKLNFYKCAGYIGIEEYKIGCIDKNSNFKIKNFNLQNKSLIYNPISLQECRECKVLPICNGKCPIEWEKCNRNEHAGCIPEKKSIEFKIDQLIKK